MLRRFIPAAAALVLVAACATITAQTDPGDGGGDQGLDIEPKELVYSEPGPEHDILDRLRGRWTQQLQFRPKAGAPAQTTELDVEYRWIMGGRFIRSHSTAFVNGEQYHGMQIIGFDRIANEYTWFQIDNMSTDPVSGRGTYDPATKTLAITGTFHDVRDKKLKETPFKMAWVFNDESFNCEYWTAGPDGKMFVMLRSESTLQ